jgi:hypothetical protein
MLPAQSNAARGLREIEKLGMPLEDWFESSLPTEHTSGSDASKPAVTAQLIHASPIHTDLKVLDGGLNTRTIAPEQPLSIYGADPRTLAHQFPTAEAMTAKAGMEWAQTERSGIGLDDQLMREIPLLFAPVPLEPHEPSIRVGFKAVVVNGMLMAGAILAVILVNSLDLKDLDSIWTSALTVLVITIALYLILRRVRSHQG